MIGRGPQVMIARSNLVLGVCLAVFYFWLPLGMVTSRLGDLRDPGRGAIEASAALAALWPHSVWWLFCCVRLRALGEELGP